MRSGDWGKSNLVVNLEFTLFSEVAQNLHHGSVSMDMRVDDPPYGQGWADKKSPFDATKLYRFTVTEI